MSIREDFLSNRLTGYLDRRSMPKGFEKKPAARDAELQALIRCMCRFAPRERYDDWWNIFEDKLAEDAKTRAWPTEGEIKSAALATRPSASKAIAEAGDFDPIAINAARIERGEAVGDGWLWDRLAVDLLTCGRVSIAQLRPYRSALYFSEKKLYGEEVARRNEQDRDQRHVEAEKIAQKRRALQAAE